MPRVVRTCTNGVRNRVALHTMTSAQWQRYAQAVLSMMRKSNRYSASLYDQHAKIHLDYQRYNHGYAPFFVWHRVYLRQFEIYLQSYDSSVMVPYWDWSLDSQAPERSFVFSPQLFGGNGRTRDLCVTNGMFSSWYPVNPTPHCLTRRWDGGSYISSWYSTEAINAAINSARSYEQLRAAIEPVPHALVHANMGPDFENMASVNDPLFWVHHAYIDLIYWLWQQRYPNAVQYNGRHVDGSPVNQNYVLAPYPDRVRDVLDTRRLCYTYRLYTSSAVVLRSTSNLQRRAVEDWPEGVTFISNNTVGAASLGKSLGAASEYILPGPHDRVNLNKLRLPRDVPKAWLQRNHHEEKPVRSKETEFRKIYNKLNQLDDYLSPCSLFNRKDVLEKLSYDNDNFVAPLFGQTLQYNLSGRRGTAAVDFVNYAMPMTAQTLSASSENAGGTTTADIVKIIGKPVMPTLMYLQGQ